MRPEHVEQDDAGNGWPMQVDAVEMLGAERLVYGRISDTPFTLRIDATRSFPKSGDTVFVSAHPEHLHWFDSQTTRRAA